MSALRYKAIFCSDLHLSIKPPALRAEEPDWFIAMQRPLRELKRLVKKLGGVPVICAGDIFDHWNAPAELITFAIQELPKMISVPGQHDLKFHSYEDIEATAYYCLVEAGVLRHIEPGTYEETDHLEVYGFPWGFKPTPCQSKSKLTKVAAIHKYCWVGKYSYANAPDENNLRNYDLSGYDASVFGDNHLGFIQGRICNCGGFMRRHSPDLDRSPFVGVLMSDGSIKKHLIDTSDDVYSVTSDKKIRETGSIELAEFTERLLGLRDSKEFDFGKVLRRYCIKNKIDRRVLEAIDAVITEERHR